MNRVIRHAFLLLSFILIGCNPDEAPPTDKDTEIKEATANCPPDVAYRGQRFNGSIEFFSTYRFEYEGINLIKMEEFEYSTNESVLTYTFDYSGDNLSHVRKSNWYAGSDYYYEYGENTRTIRVSEYIPGLNDSIRYELGDYFHPDSNEDGLYFSPFSQQVFEKSNGNFIQQGIYEVVNEDTTYVFTAFRTFDDLPNYHLNQPILFATNRQFIYNTDLTHSANNLLTTTYEDGTVSFSDEQIFYDSFNNLRVLEFSNGEHFEFHYPCDE